MFGLFLGGELVQVSHGTALYASGSVLLDQVLTDSFVESLRQVADELLGFIKLVLGQQLAEAAAHEVDSLANELVSTGAHNALAQSLFSVLEIWHTMRASPSLPIAGEGSEA